MKFYPYEKGGGRKSFNPAEGGGGHNKFWGSFYMVAWCFSHIVGGGTKSFHSLKGGGARKCLPCCEGGGAKNVSGLRFSHFVALPLPVINDQSFIVLNYMPKTKNNDYISNQCHSPFKTYGPLGL